MSDDVRDDVLGPDKTAGEGAAATDAGAQSVTLRTLERFQQQAWDSGHYRVAMRTLRKWRQAKGDDRFGGDGEQESGDDVRFSGIPSSRLPDSIKDIPGAAFLQDSPGVGGSRAPWYRRDPKPLQWGLKRVVRDNEWARMLAVAQVAEQWEQIVGPAVAQHCRVELIEADCLKVRTTSTAWAAQMRMMIPQLMHNIDVAVGAGVIEKIIVRGPDQPSWSHGPRRVKGRGVRDTYA
ncbi:MAG: DciA family protein [Actinomycetaceae bacterium]|nr:DciA family protein [Actinomycetaceae bacterium]MDU0970000.1 DciA family protein [Actinomycetaceae bacterium]